jgi:asparagine synthase (glutamine-hydrolysing)
LAASLPLEFKLKDNVNEKYILKEAFKNGLPGSVIKRDKQPYRAPDATAFLNAPHAEYLDLVFSETELKKVDVLNSDFCTKFISKLRKTDISNISPRDNQAFVFLLSTAILNRQFVKNNLNY